MAATKLLSVTLQHNQSDLTQTPNRNIVYRNNVILLSESQYLDLLSRLPSEYNSDVDKLLKFDVVKKDDGSVAYDITMEKYVFDFKYRLNKWKTYKKTNYTTEEADQLYSIIIGLYNEILISNSSDFYDEIMSKIQYYPLTALSMKRMRDELLKDSDLYMIPDYPISDEDREKWRIYRQELRDLTEQEGWPSILDVRLPVAPLPKSQFNIVNKYTSTTPETAAEFGIVALEDKARNLISSFTTVQFKLSVLSAMNTMKIPVFDGNLSPADLASRIDYIKQMISVTSDDYFRTHLDLDSESTPEYAKYESAIDHINSKIADINAKLNEIDAGFTVEDLVNDLIAKSELDSVAAALVEEL